MSLLTRSSNAACYPPCCYDNEAQLNFNTRTAIDLHLFCTIPQFNTKGVLTSTLSDISLSSGLLLCYSLEGHRLTHMLAMACDTVIHACHVCTCKHSLISFEVCACSMAKRGQASPAQQSKCALQPQALPPCQLNRSQKARDVQGSVLTSLQTRAHRLVQFQTQHPLYLTPCLPL